MPVNEMGHDCPHSLSIAVAFMALSRWLHQPVRAIVGCGLCVAASVKSGGCLKLEQRNDLIMGSRASLRTRFLEDRNPVVIFFSICRYRWPRARTCIVENGSPIHETGSAVSPNALKLWRNGAGGG